MELMPWIDWYDGWHALELDHRTKAMSVFVTLVDRVCLPAYQILRQGQPPPPSLEHSYMADPVCGSLKVSLFAYSLPNSIILTHASALIDSNAQERHVGPSTAQGRPRVPILQDCVEAERAPVVPMHHHE